MNDSYNSSQYNPIINSEGNIQANSEGNYTSEYYLPSHKNLWQGSVVVLIGTIAIGVFAWWIISMLEPENDLILFMLPYIISYGILWLFCRFYLSRVGFYAVPWHLCSRQEEVNLNNYTLNGIGTTMKGTFGAVHGFFRSYQFLCFMFVPIIPLDCIVKSSNDEDSSFRVVGPSRWHLLEIVVIMGRFWFFLFLGLLVFSLFQ